MQQDYCTDNKDSKSLRFANETKDSPGFPVPAKCGP